MGYLPWWPLSFDGLNKISDCKKITLGTQKNHTGHTKKLHQAHKKSHQAHHCKNCTICCTTEKSHDGSHDWSHHRKMTPFVALQKNVEINCNVFLHNLCIYLGVGTHMWSFSNILTLACVIGHLTHASFSTNYIKQFHTFVQKGFYEAFGHFMNFFWNIWYPAWLHLLRGYYQTCSCMLQRCVAAWLFFQIFCVCVNHQSWWAAWFFLKIWWHVSIMFALHAFPPQKLGCTLWMTFLCHVWLMHKI